MKNLIFISIIVGVTFISCSKDEQKAKLQSQEVQVHAPYDTTAIDSFSNGAISVDVAEQIRMSSKQYQDSLQQIAKQLEDEKKLKEEVDKEKKKLADEERKKADAEKKASNKSTTENTTHQ